MFCNARFSVPLLAIVFAAMANVIAVSQDADHRPVLVRVVDADDNPLAEAAVYLTYRNSYAVEEKKFETDASGVAIVELPRDAQRVTIVASKPGFVPKANRWHIPGQDVPDALDFQIQLGTAIGGEVRNTRGEPVSGAKVALKLNSRLTRFYDDGASNNMFIVWGKQAPVTDEQGRWSFSGVPADAEVRLSVTHPDYVGDQDFTTQYERDSQADLRAQTSLALLADGIRISGLVVSSDGESISAADVNMKMAPPNYSPSFHTKCGADGKFELPAVRDGKYEIAVAAKEHSPEMLTYDTRSQRLPLRIQLKRGRSVRLQVVDSDDRPIKAFVGLEKVADNDGSLLYYPSLLVPGETDAQGRFEWNSAPEGELLFNVSAPGFESIETPIPAKDAAPENIVRLQREPMLTGRVVDRATNKPIDRFIVVPIIGNHTIWRPVGVVGREGAFHLPLRLLTDNGQQFHLMIEHAGHKTILTDESFGSSSKGKELLIEMESADPIAGVVVDAEGKPVANAQVSVAESPSGLFPSQPLVFGAATTDKAGAFQFPAPPDDYSLVAVGRPGYLQKNFRSDRSQLGELPLQPWGTLEGQVVDREGEPCSDFTVTVFSPKNQVDGLPQARTMTDKNGRYRLEHLPPIRSTVSVRSRSNEGETSSAVEKKITLPPGETITVDFKHD